MSKNFILEQPDSEKLQITTFGYENFQTGPCIIHVHGFKGFKDWGFNPYLAEYYANVGYFVITFNFTHNGIGDIPLEFTELDKFAQNSYSREIDELNSIISAYKNGFFGSEGKNKIGVIGHSRGGGVAIMTAADNTDVDAIAVWASISELDRYSERQKSEWKEIGYFEMLNARTKQIMKLNYSLIEDIYNNNLNIEQSTKQLKKPFLIAHGEQDLAVPISEADDLYNWAGNSIKEIFKIPNTGHTFDCKHPFEGTNEKFNKLLKRTEEFFKSHL